jgi:hypothetical protein
VMTTPDNATGNASTAMPGRQTQLAPSKPDQSQPAAVPPPQEPPQ